MPKARRNPQRDPESLHPKHRSGLHRVLLNLLLGIAAALLGVMWVTSVVVAPVLPNQVPAHFSPDGLPDAYTLNHFWPLVGLPLIATLFTLGLVLLYLYPKYANIPGSLLVALLPKRERAWVEHIIRASLAPLLALTNLFFAYLHFSILDTAVGNRDGLDLPILAAILLFLLITGAFYTLVSVRITNAIVREVRRA